MYQKANQIVDFLKEKFPNGKIHIKYSQAKCDENHTESIQISCDENLDIKKIIHELKNHFEDIDIYENCDAGVIFIGLNKSIMPLELIVYEN